MSRTIGFVFAMMVSALAASAQQPGSPSGLDGQRVRAYVGVSIGGTPVAPTVIQGTVVRQTADSLLILDAQNTARSVSMRSLSAIEVSQGKDRKRGAVVGALIGLAAGLVATAMPIDCNDDGRGFDCRDDGSRPTRSQHAASNLLGGVTAGAAFGALLARPRWVRYPVGNHVSVSTGGGQIAVSIGR